MRNSILITTILALGCSSGSDKKATEKKDTQKKFKITQDDVKPVLANSEVPSPKEMMDILAKNGLSSDLSVHIQQRDYYSNSENKHRTAVAVGVMLSELCFSIKKAEKKELIKRLRAIQSSFVVLNAGKDINNEINEQIEEIMNPEFSRDEFLIYIDQLSKVAKAEWEVEMGKWVVPLIQAGSWLSGGNVTAAATIKEGKEDTAGKLFKKPEVPTYFLLYIKSQGKGKAPEAALKKLEVTLNALNVIAKKETITSADLKEIQSLTGDALQLL